MDLASYQLEVGRYAIVWPARNKTDISCLRNIIPVFKAYSSDETKDS